MRLLLDSHVALWWLANSVDLGSRCRHSITDADAVHFSAVTPWELGMKEALGKLTLPDALIPELVRSGFEPLNITPEHGRSAAALPLHHRDPFDRMLVAQAQSEKLVIVTADRAFTAYDVERLDART